MPKKIMFPLLALVALLAVVAAPASADARIGVRVGIGDQQPAMFGRPAFAELDIKRARYFIRWDAIRHPAEMFRAEAYVRAARRSGVRVLMHLSSDNLVRKEARLPSLRRYRRDVTRLIRHFRRLGVREWGARTKFWLTATGGIVSLGDSWRYSERRAASRLRYLFRTVRRYRRHLDRVYVYNWTGALPGARFDAGVTDRQGAPRPAYRVLRRHLRHFRR